MQWGPKNINVQTKSSFSTCREKDTKISQYSSQHSVSTADTAEKDGQTSIYLHHSWDKKYCYFSLKVFHPELLLLYKTKCWNTSFNIPYSFNSCERMTFITSDFLDGKCLFFPQLYFFWKMTCKQLNIFQK